MLRIKQKKIFNKLRNSQSKIYGNYLLIVYIQDGNNTELAVGLTVSKKVGNAVMRNKIRRRLKAILQDLLDQPDISHYLVNIIARPDSVNASYTELKNDVNKVFKKLTHYALDK